MRAALAIRNRLKLHDLRLTFLAALAGAYLAVGGVLAAAKVPDAAAWAPWSVWFVLLLVAALVVPIFGIYSKLDARFSEEARETAALDFDLVVYCQLAIAEIADQCPNVRVSELSAHVWGCQEDGSFGRRVRFFLPSHHKTSGVPWRRGKGVAGMAWELNRPLAVDLTTLHADLERLGPGGFDELPREVRAGLTHDELQRSWDYKGVVATPLYSTGSSPTLAAIFMIDYTGSGDFDCIARTAEGPRVRSFMGACEGVLKSRSASVD